MKPRIRKRRNAPYRYSTWVCEADHVQGFGSTPQSAYRDWAREHTRIYAMGPAQYAKGPNPYFTFPVRSIG